MCRHVLDQSGNAFRNSEKPVSYTQLDVYKRQPGQSGYECEIRQYINEYVTSCVRVASCRPGAFVFLWGDVYKRQVEWHQSSFAARTGFQKWGAVGFDCRGIQATVLVYEKPKHGADKGTNRCV